MAIIYSYPIVDPSANDLVLGSDVDSAGKPTKNFTVQSIIDLVTVTGNDLQAVLDNGNTATGKDINITSNNFRGGGFITTGNATISGTTASNFTSISSTAFVGTLSTAAQPNITSLGTLTSLAVNTSVTGTAVVTTLSAPGDNLKIASTKAIVDYIGTNPPGAESLSATLLVGNTTGATKIEVDNTGSGIDFIDDAKARFGTGDDLEIFHNGSHSFIKNVGTGELRIPTSMFRVTKANDSATLLEAQDAGAVKLYFANSEKIATTNTGVSVTGNTVATGSGTFVNLINSGTYSDSSADVGSAGQILSSTGSGTNWINDPNPTPYTWIIEADSGAGSPYTVANGDTIDFVGVGNVDTAWDNTSKELRISLGGTSISGTGADTQVVYWTGAQTVSGDAGMVYNDTSNNLTVSGTVQAGTLSDGTFSGTAGTYTGGVSITSNTFVGALTGNASSATQLASSGAIALTGDTTSTGGPYTYTSGGALNIATTIADTTVTGKVLTNLPTPTSAAIAASDTILAAMAKLQGQITGIPQGLVYQGTWNANTNTPTLASGTGTTGYFYIVSVAGSTNLDGITDWQVGDWAIFIEQGASDQWEKIDNTSAILGSGTANKIAKWTGSNTLATGLISDDGTDVTIGNSGNLIVEGNTTLGNADSDTTTVKGPAHFEEQLRVDEGISLGSNTYGSAGQVLTSGGGSSSVNTWTTPTTGTVTSVATNNGLTGGTITSTGTLGILTVGASNAIEFLSSATPASGDFVWFSDINDSNTLRKCTVADLQGPIGGPFLPLAGGTMTGDVIFNDDVKAKFGTSSDMSIFHNGSNSFIEQTGTGDLYIQQAIDDKDIIFRCDDGSGGLTTYMYLDGSYVGTRFPQNVQLDDDVELRLGTNQDLRLKHSGTAGTITNYVGDLTISNTQDDGDIIFKNDDGSGGTAQYFRIDGGSTLTYFSKAIQLADSVKAFFGTGGDLQIYHDGNNSKITEGGTGGLYIGSSLLGIQNNDHTEMMAQFTENGAVELYYDNSKKFETTTGGVSITGDLTVDGGTSSTINIYKDDAGNGKLSFYNDATQQVYLLHDTAENFYIHGGSGTQILMSSDNATTLTLKTGQSAQLNAYGSGTKTGTAAYNLEVDSSGNIIETPATNPGGGGGIFHGDQAVTTGSAALTFTLKRATTGTLIFDVWFTSETSTATSVAKKYVVAHSSNTTPVYNKILDTGPDGSNDFTVTFANATTTATGDSVTCSIQASGINQNIGYTVQVGYDSANALTFTAAS
jgi:hypothetical protein